MLSLVNHKRHRAGAGFTIIELLVAVGVTAVLVSLMVAITINLLNAWNRSSGQLGANASARLILDQLSQDLNGAIFKRDGNVWLAATLQDNQTGAGDTDMATANWSTGVNVKPDDDDGSMLLTGDTGVNSIADFRFGQAGVWLRFFTTPPGANDDTLEEVSAPRAVAWQIVRRQLGSAAATAQYSYHLFRSETRPFAVDDTGTTTVDEGDDNVFAVGYNLFMADGGTGSIGYNRGNAVAVGNVGNIRRPTADQLIGVDVIDFGIKLYERNAAGNLVEVFPGATPPASAPFTYAATSSTSKTLTGSGTITRGFPVEAEVLVRILTPEGARLIAAFEAGNIVRSPDFANDDDFWWDLATKHSKVYTRRVELKAMAP